ncbi:uncharacterized protein LOC133890514 isoform X1 [Phragmites australis]|uniref:uncharacterized protein LOC133890514 isoform X1 n=1 Tax=Phragmites australis TaxID=29695 RepID=UPI002D791605|nr:uncharacterized protein LOC133890514 isoform X1 [Phragmites australis]
MTFGSDGWSKKNPKSSGNQAWNLYCILIAYGSSLGEGTMDDLLSVLAARSHIVFDGFHPSIVLVELGECLRVWASSCQAVGVSAVAEDGEHVRVAWFHLWLQLRHRDCSLWHYQGQACQDRQHSHGMQQELNNYCHCATTRAVGANRRSVWRKGRNTIFR